MRQDVPKWLSRAAIQASMVVILTSAIGTTIAIYAYVSTPNVRAVLVDYGMESRYEIKELYLFFPAGALWVICYMICNIAFAARDPDKFVRERTRSKAGFNFTATDALRLFWALFAVGLPFLLLSFVLVMHSVISNSLHVLSAQ